MAARRRSREEIPDRPIAYGVSYARYSTVLQGSVEQQEIINLDVGAEFGVQIVERFKDEAISRSISSRDGLEEMYEYLDKNRHVGYIVVNEPERLTAGTGQRDRIATFCKRLHINLLTEDIGEIPWDDEEKMQLLDERAVKSQGEVVRARRRSKRAMRSLASQPDKFIKRPSFGWRVVNPKRPAKFNPEVTGCACGNPDCPRPPEEVTAEGLIIRSKGWELHPVEYPWLVRMFELSDEGLFDYQIAAWLVEQGVRTKTGRTHWTPQSVRVILTNPIYAGVYEYGANEVKRDGDIKYTEPRPEIHAHRFTKPSPLGNMIDPLLYARVQERRRQRSTDGRTRGDGRYKQPGRRVIPVQAFDHRVYCGLCGYSMYGLFDRDSAARKGPPPFRYTCSKLRATQRAQLEDFGPPCTKSHSITDKQLITAIANFGPETQIFTVNTFRNDRYQMEARMEADAEVARRQGMFERSKAMHKRNPLMVTEEEVEADWLELEKAKEIAAGFRGPGSLPRKTKVPKSLKEGVDWTTIAEDLADEAIPMADKHAALAAAGIERIYVFPGNTPVVKPKFLDG